MDCDDNDFQSQNVHLAGEGSSKFPPALRPYAHPRSDFDSLVETEIFLGIENNKDNQWIEAYSRGSSGIQLCSTAAESSSMPRHNNVWYEATSTESVEMLLKSVAQEEFIPRQTAVQESDACDELACLAKQMESKRKPDNKNEIRNSLKDFQPTGSAPENLSELREDADVEPSLAGLPKVHAGKLFIDGSSSTMQPHICKNIDLPVTESIVLTDGRSIDTHQCKVETLADSSLDEKTKDDSSASDVKTESTPSSTRIVSSTCHDIQKVHNLVVAIGAELTCSPLQTKKHDLESSVMNKDSVDTQILDGNAVSSDAHICSIPMEEGLESRSVVEDHKTRVSSLKYSLGVVSDGISDLQKAERCSEDTCLRDLSQGIPNEDARLIEDAVVDDQSTLNTCDLQKVVTKDASSSEAEVDSIKKNYSESIISKEKESLNVDTEISFSQSEASTFAMEEGNNDSRTGGLSSSGMSHVTSSTKPCISGEAIRVCENNEPDRQGENEIIFQDVSVNGQDSIKFPLDSSQMQFDVDQSHHIDKGFGLSSQSTGNVEPEVAVSTVPADVMPENNSASHIRSENISSTTLEMDIPPIPSTVESTHEVTDQIEIQSMNVIESASDVNEDCQTKAAEEAGISTPIGSLEQEVAPCSVMGTEKNGSQVKVSSNLNPPVSKSIIIRDAKHTLSTVHVSKGNDSSKDERSLTPEVNDLKGNDVSKDERSLTPVVMANLPKDDATELAKKGKNVSKRKAVSVAEANKTSTAVEGSAPASGSRTAKTKTVRNISPGTPQVSDREVSQSVSKVRPERKRRASKIAGKESSSKVSDTKGKTRTGLSEKGDKSTSIPVSPPLGFQLMQSNEVHPYGNIDGTGTKPFALLSASTSSLPDPNTSASPPVLFPQPCTDIQQAQLRAQIFVYGALVQGMAPEEAHMISAFGGPDGGRNLWEKGWRSCMERQHGPKSHPVNVETPMQSQSGPRAADLAGKESTVQGKGVSSSLGRATSKDSPTIINPLIPFSSPPWSLPTTSWDSLHSSALARDSIVEYPQALTSANPYHAPHPRNFLGHNTSWMSQTSSHGPWSASPAVTSDNSSSLSALPITDTNNLSSVKGSSVPPSSGMKNAPPDVPTSSPDLQSVFVGGSPLDARNAIISHSKPSGLKTKQRKKVMVAEYIGQRPSQLHCQHELTPGISNHPSTAAAIGTPVRSMPITTVENSVVSISPSLADNFKSDRNVQKSIQSDESVMKVEEARVHAEEASVLSAAAVNHGLEIWKQLDKQNNSGLVPDIEAKLASAAVAVAAAAAVAKAAAAAANVALNAALQAKLMADEAFVVSGSENSCQISIPEGLNSLGKEIAASILKGTNGISITTIIDAAKEAAKMKLEAASAAKKRAENMDAIVKAAGLAAEAVSQAGKIVMMGDPLPLSYLVEAGSESCWKASLDSTQQVGVLNDNMVCDLVNVDNVGERPGTSHASNRDVSSDERLELVATSEKSIDVISIVINANKKSSEGPRSRKVSNIGKHINVLPESQTEIQASFTVGNGSETLEGNNIMEGSLVEVFKDDGFKAAWFTGSVLSLKDGKAYVCYSVLVADEGSGSLKEWVSLEGEGDKPPRIRTALPLTGLHKERTRKRQRSTMIDYIWSVGDRVEAWIQESWQEGVIIDKNKKNETITVHFPGSGETSVVRASYLRPSLIWKDGKWIESSNAGANDGSIHEGDTPNEKRPKLGTPAVEVKGKDEMSKGIDAVDLVNPSESSLLNLTENDKVFNIGNNSQNDNKPDNHTMLRTGLQKEGSRVIFGVPKPGRKRKFMEVSKHYVEDGTNKTNDGNDSARLPNFLIPQGSGSGGWRNSSKSDTKEKQGADPTFKPIKPHSDLGRLTTTKESNLSTSHTKDLTSQTERIKDSSSLSKDASQSENQEESASLSGLRAAGGGPILYSSLSTSTESRPPKTYTSRARKRKLAPASAKSNRVQVEKVSSGTSEVEPRRSNRRIQPTSRLLEGLQSSLTVSKIPSSSHEKGHKNQNRTASKG
ncbi:hypothetical protein PIB30_033997 [Stylosanthes scabra]|uniref:Agenet domain-containing protein n=1 Tax=Stylosanthes scabra TaxID=79078 RepID=A0ABU6TET6_9FABA|nr:hypothetical protein [Stylosanthes scabra]